MRIETDFRELLNSINDVSDKFDSWLRRSYPLLEKQGLEQLCRQLPEMGVTLRRVGDFLCSLPSSICERYGTNSTAANLMINLLIEGNGKKSDSAVIKDIHISFGDGYTRVIDLNGSEVSYRNRIASRLSPQTFPNGYFDTKTIKLSDGQHAELMKQVAAIDFETWESDKDIFDVWGSCGAEFQLFRCRYSDCSSFVYITGRKPPDSFRTMCDLLVKYCDWSLIPSRPFLV
jgi:hypothetical protein